MSFSFWDAMYLTGDIDLTTYILGPIIGTLAIGGVFLAIYGIAFVYETVSDWYYYRRKKK